MARIEGFTEKLKTQRERFGETKLISAYQVIENMRIDEEKKKIPDSDVLKELDRRYDLVVGRMLEVNNG